MTRLLTYLIAAQALLLVGLLLWLSLYNHASPADDYCFADTVQKYGFWQAQKYYYDGWTGRYFHNFIVHASPLSMGWLGGYKLVPVLMLALLLTAFYVVGKTGEARRQGAWLFAAGALVVSVTTMPSVAEFFFWLTGIAGYSLPCVMITLWLVRVYRRNQRTLPDTIPGFLPDGLLMAALIGSSETSTLLLLSWLALITLAKLLETRTIPGFLVVYWAVAVVSILCLVLAPGNAIRLSTGPTSHDVPALLRASMQYTAGFVGHRLLHSTLLPMSLLYLPVAYRLAAPGWAGRYPFLKLPVWLVGLHVAATVWTMVFLHYWAVGIEPAPRVQNLVNHAGLLGWLLSLTVLMRWVRSRWVHLPNERARLHNLMPVFRGVGAVWLLVLVYQNNVIRQMASDLWSGRARQYSVAMEARYAVLATPRADTLTMAPLPTMPVSLVIDDIRTEPNHLWNKCWAGYFHQKSVILKK
jgi:Family of unknown function (DUF6056)